MICRDSEGVFLDEKYEVVPAFNEFRDVISPGKISESAMPYHLTSPTAATKKLVLSD
jgi:hypothetical protein